MIRDDLSNLLIHLTKGEKQDPKLVLEEVIGNSNLSHIFASPSVHGFKYTPHGKIVGSAMSKLSFN